MNGDFKIPIVDAVLGRIKFLLRSSRISNLTISRIVESCLKLVNDRFSKGDISLSDLIQQIEDGFIDQEFKKIIGYWEEGDKDAEIGSR